MACATPSKFSPWTLGKDKCSGFETRESGMGSSEATLSASSLTVSARSNVKTVLKLVSLEPRRAIFVSERGLSARITVSVTDRFRSCQESFDRSISIKLHRAFFVYDAIIEVGVRHTYVQLLKESIGQRSNQQPFGRVKTKLTFLETSPAGKIPLLPSHAEPSVRISKCQRETDRAANTPSNRL